MNSKVFVVGFVAFLAVVSAIALYTNLTHEPRMVAPEALPPAN